MARQWEQSGSAPGAMAKVERLLQEKLRDTREQMQRLQALESELQASLSYLQTCPTCDPKQIIDACASCELHSDSEPAPELVAGFSAH
jgi:MerR family copper efflux transcriptional regulator